MDNENQRLLTGLLDRQAILDCVTRYCRGVDRLDREILLSAYHPDAIDDHGTFCGSPEAFADYVIPMHQATHLSHQHCLFNHSCDLDGDVAHCETYFMFLCMNRQGPATGMTSGRYIDRFEKRAGEWRIARRICIRDWAALKERPDDLTQATMTSRASSLPPAVAAFMIAGSAPSRDCNDPSYARPLNISEERLAAGLALRVQLG